jgi:hypothetical protein
MNDHRAGCAIAIQVDLAIIADDRPYFAGTGFTVAFNAPAAKHGVAIVFLLYHHAAGTGVCAVEYECITFVFRIDVGNIEDLFYYLLLVETIGVALGL